ncbi:TPR-repeat protein, partial [Trypanosoma cruzi]
MEAAMKDEGIQTGTSSSSSSFTSYADAPSKRSGPDNGVVKWPSFGQPNLLHGELDPPSAKWLERFMSTYFLCELCHRIVMDPVQILPNTMMTCRRCALSRRVSTDAMAELPLGVVQAFEELCEAHRRHQKPRVFTSPEAGATKNAGDDSIAGRRTVRVKRNDAIPGSRVVKSIPS